MQAFTLVSQPAFAEVLGCQQDIAELPERWLFLDTETTGLAGGAGSFAFLVGVGYFDEAGFRLRQYFMRDPAEEAAMLEALRNDFGERAGFVTYNGKTFDIPLLEMRYMIGRRERLPLGRCPQMDLLYLVRRLWKRQLPDCRLGTVERMVMQIERNEADVPGAEIPRMYSQYLQTGQTGDMLRVLYHNEIDILSLVVLATEILARHTLDDLKELSGSEALGLARWHLDDGRFPQAEHAYLQAAMSSDVRVRAEALRHLTTLMKRLGRREEAVRAWIDWQGLEQDNPAPSVELAKYYEWHAGDVLQARDWALRAREAVETWPGGWRKDLALEDIDHRLARLARKLAG
ncbi:MAG: ribonuclease H-like domain-containing protein [Anaerolineales bacterium]|nr:ribonuclease H-like domain-containing protein [Anaerolineales bacterium]